MQQQGNPCIGFLTDQFWITLGVLGVLMMGIVKAAKILVRKEQYKPDTARDKVIEPACSKGSEVNGFVQRRKKKY